MARRIVTIESPGVAGMAPDLEKHLLTAQHAVRITDGYVGGRGVLHQRRAWAHYGSTGAGIDLLGLAAQDFLLAGTSRILSTSEITNVPVGVRIDPTTGDDTLVFEGALDGADYLWRCSYGDQAVACAQDGLSPARFYSGSALVSELGTSNYNFASGKATVTLSSGTFSADVQPGTYICAGYNATDTPPAVFLRVVERVSDTVLTLENIKASAATSATQDPKAYACGFSYPCVSVYSAGTGTMDAAADTFVGTGTKWFSGSWGTVVGGDEGSDALLRIVPSTGGGRMYRIDEVISDTQLNVENGTSVTDAKYHIARRMPAKDADNWNGMLVFAGVYQHKNRVYFWPPGANPALPPGFSPIAATTGVATPYDPATSLAYANPDDFLCDYIEVPARDDDDPIIGIRATPANLLVAKANSIHAIVGFFPNFDTFPIERGVGCFDIRSLQTTPVGRIFCDHQGIWREREGRVENLAEQAGFGTTWRTTAQDFHRGLGDRCAVGYDSGHLLVSIDPRVGDTATFVLDMRDTRPRLVSKWTNHQAVGYASIYLPSIGLDGLYWVGPDAGQGRIADSRPILDDTGDAVDDDGTAPSFDYLSGSSANIASRVGRDARLTRLRFDVNLAETAGASSILTPSVISDQRFDDLTAEATTTLDTITAKNYDGVASYYRSLGIRASQHQVRLAKTATASDETACELHRIVMDFRTREKPL